LPVIREVLNELRGDIHGLIHCSGGAQTKVLHFIEKNHVVKDNLFDLPPLFRIIQQQSQTDWSEMYKVFNMGHRMELYVPQEIAQRIIDISTSFGIPAQIIGQVLPSEQKQLTITSPFGTFNY
jgi:phosphoribosylformylglycinamidine cyclo-ligase